jgi:hypothetical protein
MFYQQKTKIKRKITRRQRLFLSTAANATSTVVFTGGHSSTIPQRDIVSVTLRPMASGVVVTVHVG